MQGSENTVARPFLSDTTASYSYLLANEALTQEYLRWCAETRNRSPETVRTYGTTLSQWVRWLTERPLADATVEEMQDFVQRPRERRAAGRKGTAATQAKDVAVLRAFYGWACEFERIEGKSRARSLYAPTVHNVAPKPVTDDTWRALVRCDMAGSERVAFGLGFFCGLRRQEIIRLERRHFSDGMIVDFQRKGGGEHSVPWSDMLRVYSERLPGLLDDRFVSELHALTSVRRSDTPKLLPWWTSNPVTINKRLTRVCRENGIGHISPHMFRHATATNLLRADVPIHIVSRLLNHSNIQITMRYVKAGAAELREWLG